MVFWNPQRWPRKLQVVAFIAFWCIMGVLGWFSYRIEKESWNSPSVSFLVQFIPMLIFMSWVGVTRTFSLWTRWVVPLIGVVLCFFIFRRAELAARQFMSVYDERSLRMFASWYLGFFLVVVAWIVAMPIEEAVAKLGIATRTNRVVWRLRFAIAGISLIALASVLVLRSLFDLPLEFDQLVSICHDLFYLAIAFYFLFTARLVVPWSRVGRGQRTAANIL